MVRTNLEEIKFDCVLKKIGVYFTTLILIGMTFSVLLTPSVEADEIADVEVQIADVVFEVKNVADPPYYNQKCYVTITTLEPPLQNYISTGTDEDGKVTFYILWSYHDYLDDCSGDLYITIFEYKLRRDIGEWEQTRWKHWQKTDIDDDFEGAYIDQRVVYPEDLDFTVDVEPDEVPVYRYMIYARIIVRNAGSNPTKGKDNTTDLKDILVVINSAVLYQQTIEITHVIPPEEAYTGGTVTVEGYVGTEESPAGEPVIGVKVLVEIVVESMVEGQASAYKSRHVYTDLHGQFTCTFDIPTDPRWAGDAKIYATDATRMADWYMLSGDTAKYYGPHINHVAGGGTARGQVVTIYDIADPDNEYKVGDTVPIYGKVEWFHLNAPGGFHDLEGATVHIDLEKNRHITLLGPLTTDSNGCFSTSFWEQPEAENVGWAFVRAWVNAWVDDGHFYMPSNLAKDDFYYAPLGDPEIPPRDIPVTYQWPDGWELGYPVINWIGEVEVSIFNDVSFKYIEDHVEFVPETYIGTAYVTGENPPFVYRGPVANLA
ncbi:MAG: hypothetical protein JSV09_01880 [Thermoplasmata archaeon]|nr:MAG: hypothetical protein JSV09_01880 [Thermoplasmata archaeon]